jgi:thiamine pyrophosphate-dependent acetolactate synthase large subunit-like protein
MYGQELATAMKYSLPIIVLVINNPMYGTIRMHQERSRVYGTDLINPDFAAFARAFGAHGKIVNRIEEFGALPLELFLSQHLLGSTQDKKLAPAGVIQIHDVLPVDHSSPIKRP